MLVPTEWNTYCYEMGFAHGTDATIAPPCNADPAYRLGFATARNQNTKD